MKIAAYTISQQPSEWNLEDVSWTNYVDNTPIDKIHRTEEYLRYIAEKRNYAVNSLIEDYPDTTDVMCCDSAYVDQTMALRKLMVDYERVKDTILGGAIYGPWRQRARDVFRPRITWSDPWGVPDMAWTKPNRRGLITASGVSGVHIFPINIWKADVRYSCYWPDTNRGTETTHLARDSRLDILIDMDAMFYRDRRFSRTKCLRISAGIGTKLRRLVP